MTTDIKTNQRILFIIAAEGFRDEEYAEPKAVLEKAGYKITTASTKMGMAHGKLGMTANVDILIKDTKVTGHDKVTGYDAVVFVGGPGSYDLFDNADALRIAREAVKEGKVLGGICAAAAVLAHAEVLKQIKATSFPGVSDELIKNGANYTGKGVEVDGKIITADGPAHARQFGEAIVKVLNTPSSA